MAKTDATSTDAVITVTTPPRFWEANWPTFNRSYPELARRSSLLAPLYCLPKSAITCLGKMRGKSPPMLDPAAVEAETAFSDLCEQFQAVGAWPNRPIPYSFLTPPTPLPDA